MDSATLINEAHAKKEYRPVAVAIIKNMIGHVLIVQSAKNRDEWYFPQGGIDENETIESALFRELHEELGLTRENLVFGECLGFEDVDAEETRKDKRGFTRGKRYFFCTVSYRESNEYLRLNPQEISSCLWVDIADIEYIFISSRMEKRDLMLRWLNGA